MDQQERALLVVDDEPALRDIFSGWLKSLGIGQVFTACDGLDALAILATTEIALLVTDVRMPGMDGTTLLRRLATLTQAPSIVIVSTAAGVDEREMYHLGAESFLSKPMQKENLTRAVLGALAEREELWKEKPTRLPRQQIVIGNPNPGERSFELGRGGFCARFEDLIGLGKIGFECHAAADRTILRGTGIVRWRSRVERLIGVEFTYLDDSSRMCVVDELAATRPHSFIPANVSLPAVSL